MSNWLLTGLFNYVITQLSWAFLFKGILYLLISEGGTIVFLIILFTRAEEESSLFRCKA